MVLSPAARRAPVRSKLMAHQPCQSLGDSAQSLTTCQAPFTRPPRFASGPSRLSRAMNNFEYAAPRSLVEATAWLASNPGTARILAGGTDLIVQLRERLREADLVVDVKRVPELSECVDSETAGLRLGAAVPCSQIYENERLA